MTEGVINPPQPRGSRRRVRVAAALAGVVLVSLVIAGVLAATRYLPALDEARALRSDMEALATGVEAAGLDLDRPTIDRLQLDLVAGRGRLDGLADLLLGDPLIGVARALSLTRTDVDGADALVEAARDLFDAVEQGLSIGERFVEIKEARANGPETPSTLARLVELMATSRDSAMAAQAAFRRADAALARVPDGPGNLLGEVRDAIARRLDTYGPSLDAYVDVSERLPSILGWDGPRRYLVLTQNPAELRPTGGFIGSYGIVTFDGGRVTERAFRDVALLDFPWDYPFVAPPQELADYLLGPDQPWQLADANWSPDFPTSAQDALRLYTNESGDARIDGVLGITTYTIDELLLLTGPVTVPEYDATIASGETTLKTVQLTRAGRAGENRKAFLSAFGDLLFDRLVDLPSARWGDLVGRAGTFRDQHLLLAWFKDPADQRLASTRGFDGAVRHDPGDYVYPVDSNVAPASKINAIATRSLRLDVTIDAGGDARHTLDVTWDNPIDTAVGRPWLEVATLENMRNLGMYFRLLVPEGTRFQDVSGGSVVDLTAPAVTGVEAGRTVFGSQLLIPPGATSLRYRWVSPQPVEIGTEAHRYRLTIQKQPGLRPGPLTVTIRVPAGFRIQAADPTLHVAGDTASVTQSFDRDLELDLSFVTIDPGTAE